MPGHRPDLGRRREPRPLLPRRHPRIDAQPHRPLNGAHSQARAEKPSCCTSRSRTDPATARGDSTRLAWPLPAARRVARCSSGISIPRARAGLSRDLRAAVRNCKGVPDIVGLNRWTRGRPDRRPCRTGRVRWWCGGSCHPRRLCSRVLHPDPSAGGPCSPAVLPGESDVSTGCASPARATPGDACPVTSCVGGRSPTAGTHARSAALRRVRRTASR